MKQKLKLKGHIIDSLVLSKLLDEISNLGIECYATDIKVGKRREKIILKQLLLSKRMIQKK